MYGMFWKISVSTRAGAGSPSASTDAPEGDSERENKLTVSSWDSARGGADASRTGANGGKSSGLCEEETDCRREDVALAGFHDA